MRDDDEVEAKRGEGVAKTALMSGAGQVGAPVRRLSLLFSIQIPAGGKPETRRKCGVAPERKSEHEILSLKKKNYISPLRRLVFSGTSLRGVFVENVREKFKRICAVIV